tara:strand:- start:193 stop:891 length:699 start_codon:yes stop_codon:yes gene_type:complete
MQAISLQNNLAKLFLSVLILPSFFSLKAQEKRRFEVDTAISPVMISVNALTSIIGEYGGNVIFSVTDKSQALLTFNFINSEIKRIDASLGSGKLIETTFNQGFSISPEYRYILGRSKRKNWISSYFIGAYFMYQQVYEAAETDLHFDNRQSPPFSEYKMKHIADYTGSSLGLTFGVNLYSNSNFFISLWTGRGFTINEKLSTLFQSDGESIEELDGLRDLGFRSGLSIGIYF